MTIQRIITSATSDAQREEAARVGVPCFVRGFEGRLATAEAFQDQDDIDGAALASGIAAIRARSEAGFDAGTYLELQGTRRISASPTRSIRETLRPPAASASREVRAMPGTRKSHHVRQDVTRLPAGSDARWRAEYRQAQYERVLIGIQGDLLGGPAVEVFRASPKQPAPPVWTPDYDVGSFHDLPPEEQARQLDADPQTPFARTTRASLTAEEIAALVASAANWLRVGQAVRITGAPLTLDGSAERRVGRTGVIWRLCSAVFADHVYVDLDLIGAERSKKVVFVELRDVTPIEWQQI